MSCDLSDTKYQQPIYTKILCVEDPVESRNLLARVLQHIGYEYFGVDTGREGIDWAIKNEPDLIMVEIAGLFDLSAEDISDVLKSNQKTAHIPLIALIPGTVANVEKILPRGYDGYILKPIDIDELPNQIKSFIEHRK